MSDFITAGIRTISPMIVGAVASWLITLGLTVSEDLKSSLVVLITFALSAAYYLIVKALERKFPQLGWLLGSPKQPVYGDKGEDKPATLATPFGSTN